MYNTALPYFFEEDIENIINEIRFIINGDGHFTKGPKVKEFEESFANYVGSEYGVALNSCTSALEIVLKTIGINEKHEVIVPVQTFISTGSCVVSNGAKPIFCEIDSNHLIDFEDLKKKITSKTKAVIIVHYLGLIHPQIFEIKKYLKEKNIFLIEDAAHAHGAKFGETYAGSIGDFGCFSFYSTKIMTTGGEGGLITTNNKQIAKLCSSYGNIGIDIDAGIEIFNEIGSNKRMNEIQAIFGIYQLKQLTKFVNHRNKIANIYLSRLKELKEDGIIDFQNYPSNIVHSYWRFMVQIKSSKYERLMIQKNLKEEGIKIDWPYQPLMHLQPIFKRLYGIKEGHLKKSEDIAKNNICLPIHLGINNNDAEIIADKFLKVFE